MWWWTAVAAKCSSVFQLFNPLNGELLQAVDVNSSMTNIECQSLSWEPKVILYKFAKSTVTHILHDKTLIILVWLFDIRHVINVNRKDD